MSGLTTADDATACEFRTAHDVKLWPVEIVAANYFTFAPDLPLSGLPVRQRIRGGLRIRLKSTAGLTFKKTAIDRLTFYFAGRDDVANTLHELCLASGLGVLVLPAHGSQRSYELVGASSINPVGFADDEALLPVTLRSFQGYRLLQEYFAFPQRYRFVELSGLRRAAEPGRRERGGTGRTARAWRPDARSGGRPIEPGAPLHASAESVSEAHGPDQRQLTAHTNSTSCPIARDLSTSRSTR